MVAATGWQRIGPNPAIAAWAAAALPLARLALAQTDQPLRCGGTWAVGLDLLDNDTHGTVAGAEFPWAAVPLAREPLHRGQVSAIYPGYPQPWQAETAAAYQFRKNRDAAHLDGLLPIGPEKRRMIKEPHAWILGIALNDCGCAPLVVYEGSHLLMRAAMMQALAPHAPRDWADVDVTNAYQAARARVFATCRRIEVPVLPGEATLLHRHMLHGVAPWGADARPQPDGRIIAYFRPLMASVQDWLAPN